MALRLIVGLAAAALTFQGTRAPACQPDGNRRSAERVHGVVKKGERLSRTTAAGWIVTLVPDPEGWFLQVTSRGRESEDLARLTPPWHFVPNPREIEGWHFRNANNTGPNDGSVNAPQELREFIFSPEVGRGIEYNGSGTSGADVEKVRAFGRGGLFIDAYTLTPPKQGERAAFESMTFSACLTWPADAPLEPPRR